MRQEELEPRVPSSELQTPHADALAGVLDSPSALTRFPDVDKVEEERRQLFNFFVLDFPLIFFFF